MTREARALSVRIARTAAEAYAFLARPENFAKWASWVAAAPSPAALRFSEPNAYGVLDHQVRVPDGMPIYVPLRVVANGAGCELVLTLFRRPELSDANFAAEADRVMHDLLAAKRMLET